MLKKSAGLVRAELAATTKSRDVFACPIRTRHFWLSLGIALQLDRFRSSDWLDREMKRAGRWYAKLPSNLVPCNATFWLRKRREVGYVSSQDYRLLLETARQEMHRIRTLPLEEMNQVMDLLTNVLEKFGRENPGTWPA